MSTDQHISELLASMRKGYAVELHVAELEVLERDRVEIRTSHNVNAIGTRSRPYVGWIDPSGKRYPPKFVRWASGQTGAAAGKLA